MQDASGPRGDVRQDVVRRLEAAGIDYYVTGSEAMAIHGIAYRQTNDIDMVLRLDEAGYDRRLRPAFEPAYLVSDLVRIPPRRLGSAIAVSGAVGKADFILRDAGTWASTAFDRRQRIEDPGLGMVWVASPEDVLLAKLEWAEGDFEGLQGRDVRRLVEAVPELDRAYLRTHAGPLGLTGFLAEVLPDAD